VLISTELAANEVKRRKKNKNKEKNSNIYLQQRDCQLLTILLLSVDTMTRLSISAMQRLSGFFAHAQSINRQ